ncbi:MAG: VOC family protein [Bacteroidota bacterium]
MKIEHLAIWAKDLEGMRVFYQQFFDFESNDMYHNPAKGFRSYFLSFGEGARIEIMHREDVEEGGEPNANRIGLAHFAISLGSRERVDELTEQIRSAGYKVVGEPRTTGDGYYESVIEDPEGNHIELTA